MTSSEYKALTARKTSDKGNARTPAPGAAGGAREAPQRGLFGSHEVAEFPGSRFVATGATEACIQELTAVCARHGMRCASTAHFMKQSESHAKAKK